MKSTETVIMLKRELEEVTTDHVSLETQLRLAFPLILLFRDISEISGKK